MVRLIHYKKFFLKRGLEITIKKTKYNRMYYGLIINRNAKGNDISSCSTLKSHNYNKSLEDLIKKSLKVIKQ